MSTKLLLCLIAVAAAAFGQTTFATLTGTVTDPAGATVPNATLTATHVQSNYLYTAKSNESGNYNIPQLREGAYTLRVQSPGFKESRIQNIALVSLDVRRINITLEIGAVDNGSFMALEIRRRIPGPMVGVESASFSRRL